LATSKACVSVSASGSKTIAYILLADASRVVYSTDVELETGRAKTGFLRVIQPLRFPGATTAPVTNLMVQTVDARGQNRLYTFDIVHSSNPRYVGVQILSATHSEIGRFTKCPTSNDPRQYLTRVILGAHAKNLE